MYTPKFYRDREANTLKIVNHENIVRFVAMEQDAFRNQFLIMEYCSEGDLEKFLNVNTNGLPMKELDVFVQHFVNALQHLTEKHIVHRDLKPGNILMSLFNGQRIYKIADFGAARVLNPDIFAQFYGDLLDGTLPTRSFNENHELWSIGVTLYETATGKLPFEPKDGRKDPTKLYKMTNEKPNGHISAIETRAYQ